MTQTKINLLNFWSIILGAILVITFITAIYLLFTSSGKNAIAWINAIGVPAILGSMYKLFEKMVTEAFTVKYPIITIDPPGGEGAGELSRIKWDNDKCFLRRTHGSNKNPIKIGLVGENGSFRVSIPAESIAEIDWDEPYEMELFDIFGNKFEVANFYPLSKHVMLSWPDSIAEKISADYEGDY